MGRRDLGLIWALMSPETRHRIAQQERDAEKRLIARGGEPWDEDKTKFKDPLVIDGTTFKPKLRFDVTPVNLVSEKLTAENHVIAPGGAYAYRNSILPAGRSLELWQGARRGRVYFTTDVVIPALVKWPLENWHGCWMSYTPAEVLSQRQGVRLAKGKVVIGGLGLGYFLEKVARKRSVKEIVLVELSQDLLDWYGNTLVEQLRQETGKPITIICGDAMEELGKHGDETRYLYDIWDSFPVDLYGKDQEKVDRVKHFWGWGCLAESAWRD